MDGWYIVTWVNVVIEWMIGHTTRTIDCCWYVNGALINNRDSIMNVHILIDFNHVTAHITYVFECRRSRANRRALLNNYTTLKRQSHFIKVFHTGSPIDDVGRSSLFPSCTYVHILIILHYKHNCNIAHELMKRANCMLTGENVKLTDG
jgi:hypothetical protein